MALAYDKLALCCQNDSNYHDRGIVYLRSAIELYRDILPIFANDRAITVSRAIGKKEYQLYIPPKSKSANDTRQNLTRSIQKFGDHLIIREKLDELILGVGQSHDTIQADPEERYRSIFYSLYNIPFSLLYSNVDRDKTIISEVERLLSALGVSSTELPHILAELGKRYGLASAASQADERQPINAGKTAQELPPPDIEWPTETYSGSPEAKRGGGGIVAYLERVWLPIMQAVPGAVDLRRLRSVDQSAAMAVNAYTKRNPHTGERRQLPSHLQTPTIKEMNDLALAGGLGAIARDVKLARVVATRVSRGKKIPYTT